MSSSESPNLRSRFLDSVMLSLRRSLFVPVILPSLMAVVSTAFAELDCTQMQNPTLSHDCSTRGLRKSVYGLSSHGETRSDAREKSLR